MEHITDNELLQYERARKRVRAIRGFYTHLFAYILVNIFLLVLKWTDLKPDENFFTFSTFATAFFWGFGLAYHAFNVFGISKFFSKNWEERKIKEFMEYESRDAKKWE